MKTESFVEFTVRHDEQRESRSPPLRSIMDGKSARDDFSLLLVGVGLPIMVVFPRGRYEPIFSPRRGWMDLFY